MLSKEEIEKAKEEIKEIINLFYEYPNPQSVLLQDNELQYLETLLQYINQLEYENNKQNKIINETINYIASLDIEEDICEKIGKTDCDKMAFGECESCLRKFFEKKVEEK